MDNENTRFLFNSLREDIKSLREEIRDVLNKHEQDINGLKAFNLRVAGAGALAVILTQVAWKFISVAIK